MVTDSYSPTRQLLLWVACGAVTAIIGVGCVGAASHKATSQQAVDTLRSTDAPACDHIRIQGAVHYPGDFQVLSYLTVLAALDIAGGTTVPVTDITIRVKRSTGETLLLLTRDQTAQALLYRGDTATIELRRADSTMPAGRRRTSP
jgi:hypothetical protein